MKPKKLVRRVIFCFVALTMLVLSSTAVPQVEASTITDEKINTFEKSPNNVKLDAIKDKMIARIFNLLDIFEQHKKAFRKELTKDIYEAIYYLSKNRHAIRQLLEETPNDENNLILFLNCASDVLKWLNFENRTTFPTIVITYLNILSIRLTPTLLLYVLSRVISRITPGPLLGRRLMGKTSARISATFAIIAIGLAWIYRQTGYQEFLNWSKLALLDVFLYLLKGFTHPMSFFPHFITILILYGVGLIIAISIDLYLEEKL